MNVTSNNYSLHVQEVVLCKKMNQKAIVDKFIV
jgi:hypothetical protein